MTAKNCNNNIIVITAMSIADEHRVLAFSVSLAKICILQVSFLFLKIKILNSMNMRITAATTNVDVFMLRPEISEITAFIMIIVKKRTVARKYKNLSNVILVNTIAKIIEAKSAKIIANLKCCTYFRDLYRELWIFSFLVSMARF
jgi:hypothetical protein